LAASSIQLQPGRAGAVRAYSCFFRTGSFHPRSRTAAGGRAETQLGRIFDGHARSEIRGAGELLGTRQSGHIQAVGFHLYTRLLADAVRRLRYVDRLTGSQVNIQPSNLEALRLAKDGAFQPLSMPVNVDLPLAIGLPTNYIADQDLRLRLYRRIADLRDETEIDALVSEFTDRFGDLPDMVVHLFYQVRVKLRAEKAGLAGVNWEGGHRTGTRTANEEGLDGWQISVRIKREVILLVFVQERLGLITKHYPSYNALCNLLLAEVNDCGKI
jgi:transcription-repair coupling factor (superfamily II helicase)